MKKNNNQNKTTTKKYIQKTKNRQNTKNDKNK